MKLLPWKKDGDRYWRFIAGRNSVAAVIQEETSTLFGWTVDPYMIHSPWSSIHGSCTSLEKAKIAADNAAIKLGWQFIDGKLLALI